MNARHLARAACAALLCIAGTVAVASSVREADFRELAQRSELVFEGIVRHIEARSDSPGAMVRTWVTFDVVDVIKGADPGSTVILSFLGGTANGRTLQVADLVVPQPGEHGIYFVESISRRLVNPLYGWTQGHFLVIDDADGVGRVHTGTRRAVSDIDPTPAAPPAPRLSRGVARGVESATTGNPQALSVSKFKSLVRGIAAPSE